MRRSALLIVSLLVAALFPAAPAAALEPGCTPTELGYTCLSAPIEIIGGQANGPANGYVDLIPSIPEPGYITSARATLVDEQGQKIDHHYAHLHHAVWLNASEKDFTCSSIPDRFFATGKERTRMTLPEGYGYHWSNEPSTAYEWAGTNWLLNYHIDGMHAGHDLTGHLRLNVTFVPASEAALTAIEPVWLDVDGACGNSEFVVEKGSGRNGIYKQDWEYWMPQAGSFVALAGHLHDGGIKLKLRNTTTDSHIFTSRALYEARREPGYLTGMTNWSGLPGYSVAMNDVLRLRAVYDSTKERDAMGIMMAAFVPAP